jgi:hypothetical protein
MFFKPTQKTLPCGIGNFLLNKTLKYFKNNYDDKEYGYYKIEIDRQNNNVNYVLKNPLDNNSPFRICLITFPLLKEERWLDDLVACQISMFYKSEVKETLGEEDMLQVAIKKYGGNFKIADRKEGFYKIYKWVDTETEVELAFGYQVDRLRFTTIKSVLISDTEKKDIPISVRSSRFSEEKIF